MCKNSKSKLLSNCAQSWSIFSNGKTCITDATSLVITSNFRSTATIYSSEWVTPANYYIFHKKKKKNEKAINNHVYEWNDELIHIVSTNVTQLSTVI